MHQTPSARRVILIGASNLTRGFPIVLNTCHNLLGGPLEVLAALGHGRSYGIASRVLGRTLPSVLDCGLWDALDASNRRAAASLNTPLALITDIGNDIMYDQPPETIAAWVAKCVVQLRATGAHVAMTQMPLASIRSLQPWRFNVVRSLLFPTRRLRFDDAMQRLNELHERLLEIADRFDISLIELPAAWYGLDPIHIKRSAESEAWLRILGQVFTMQAGQEEGATASLASRWQLRRMRPASWKFFGVARHRSQPTAQLRGGTTISLY